MRRRSASGMGSGLSFLVERWVKIASPSDMVSRSPSIGSVLQPGEKAIDALGEAALDLITAVAVLVLALLEGVVDVTGLPHELLEGEDVPAPRLCVGAEHLLLLLGHGQDEMRLRDDLPMPPEIGGAHGVLGQMNAVFPEHDARVQRGNHAVARMIGDAAGAHSHALPGAPLVEHLLEEHVGHHAATGVGMADKEDVFQRSSRGHCQKRTPLPRSFHSSFGRSWSVRPKLVPGASWSPWPNVSGRSFTSSSGSSRRSASMRRMAWG